MIDVQENKKWIRIFRLTVTVAVGGMFAIGSSVFASEQPNFLIIMIDDLGYGDLGIHGGYAPTPNMDKLFRSGLVLENFMVTPLCSPTRAALLTGRNPLPINQGPYVDGFLNPGIKTFGAAFREHGYATGVFGKWHNSIAPVFNSSMPDVNDYGFDEWVGGYGGGFDFFTKIWPNNTETTCWYHNRTHVVDDQTYATDSLTDHALQFITEHKGDPFVCYVPYNAMHTPLHAKAEDIKRVPKKIADESGGLRSWKEYYKMENTERWGGRLYDGYVQLTGDHSMDSIGGRISNGDRKVIYAAMMMNLDDNVGRLLEYLKESGLEENTVVWFFSDNGGENYQFVRNDPLRGGKHTIWEGGIHSRAVIRWPAMGWNKKRQFDGLMGCQDVYPTCMEMAGFDVSGADEIEGRSCYDAMLKGNPTPVDAYYYLWEGMDVIRTAQWKLIRYADREELYDMKSDICEKSNVAIQYPEQVSILTAKLNGWMEKNEIKGGHLPHSAVRNSATSEHPAPLEVVFSQTGPCNSRNHTVVTIMERHPFFYMQTGDQLEYDIMFDSSSKTDGGHLTLHRGTGPLFLDQSVDQFGQLFSADYSYEDARGKWVHRVVGMGQGCPLVAGALEFMITGSALGRYHFYLDNVVVHRRDGSTRSVWCSGMPAPGAKASSGISGLEVIPHDTKGVSLSEHGARITNYTIPSVVQTGSTFQIEITVCNEGSAVWSASGNYCLGAVGDSDLFAETLRHRLNAAETISSGESKTFTFSMTAPSEPGTYQSDWRMLQEAVEWFGQKIDVEVAVVEDDVTLCDSSAGNL